MKICICSDGYPSKGLPYSAFIQVLAREMVRQGCDVDVIAPQSLTNILLRGGRTAPLHYKDIVLINGYNKEINIYRPYTLTFGEGLLGKWTPRFNRWATEFSIWMHHIRPDVFYSHFWANAFNAVKASKRQVKPLFVATGEDKISITKFLSKEDVAEIRNRISGVICVSTKNQDESVGLLLTEVSKCQVLPNAYDPAEFYQIDRKKSREDLGFPKDAFIVAFCGRFNKRKGAMRVAEAIRELKDSDIKSIFIGAPADNETEIPECEGVLFRGSLIHKDIVKYLNCADVFVLPSQAEGCPNSVIEAMACGLPIISSDLSFNYDILSNDTAILVDPNDVHAIADAINELKNNKQLRYRLAESSLLCAKELTISNRVKKILEFITSHAKK